ncbi:MAG TPA: YbaL family putative K(+) efflux transporter [Burkholderiaceae bacterium]|nr:YbaL family putative K(+) efflux transporter [Burkholderiaceae bacterium]
MPDDASLITTVVIALVLAFCGGFVAKKLHLPALVGYLLAGVAVGPFTPGFVGDINLARQLAEIGIVLLMFGVGLHFSARDLLAVRRIALPGAVGQIAVATSIGAGIALAWGWSLGPSLILGLALSVASTVVLLRALEERNALTTVNGHIAVGWLVVEDLAMVLVLVLLPALARALGSDTSAGAVPHAGAGFGLTLLLTIGKLALFVVLVVVVGKRLVPWLLEQVARTGSRELFTLCVLAVALGIAFASAELFGVSFALGAFFAGVVLSESDFSHQAAADSLPLKDAFAVLFFVSVGMTFDPGIFLQRPTEVLAVVLVVVLGKSLVAFAIVLAFGYPVTTALTVSASLAQIGEFSFILAGLGVAFGLLPPEGRDLILAAAIVSITLNPLLFAAIDPLTGWLQRRPRATAWLEREGDRLATLSTARDEDGAQDHAVIVGYGRVGRMIGDVLQAQRLPFVVVEQNRRLVESLRQRGVHAVYGDATAAGVLKAARVERARLLIVATPEGFQLRRILELARKANPRIDTAVRTHSVGELAYLERQGVGAAIMGGRELALGLTDYALRSLGTSENKARLIVQEYRTSGEGGAFERRSDVEPPRPVPELLPPRDPSD